MMGWIDSFASWIGGLFGSTKPAKNLEQVKAIQACAVQTCNFLPMVESVIGILATGNPAVMTAQSVANYICSIVTKSAPVAPIQTFTGSAPAVQTWVTPGGLTIQGSFVKK